MSIIHEMSQALKVPFNNEWDTTLTLDEANYPGIVNALHQLGFDMTNLGEPGKTEVWQQDQTGELLVLAGSGEQFDPYTLAEPGSLDPRFFQREFGFAEWIDEVLSTYRVNRRKMTNDHAAWLENYFTITHEHDMDRKHLQDYMKGIK